METNTVSRKSYHLQDTVLGGVLIGVAVYMMRGDSGMVIYTIVAVSAGIIMLWAQDKLRGRA